MLITRLIPRAEVFLSVLALCSGACTPPLSYETWGAELQAPQRVVVLFHGYGVPPTDLSGMVVALKDSGAPESTCYVLVAGPLSLGEGRAGWYKDRSEMAKLRPRVLALLEKLHMASGVAYGQIFTGGFSQGATVAIDAALFSPEPLGGVLAVSPMAGPPGDWSEAMQRQVATRFLVVHGTNDIKVLFSNSRMLVQHLTAAGHKARLVEHKLEHVPAEETFPVMAEFLGESD